MKKYVYYRPNKTVIGMRLTKSTYKDVLSLIENHGGVETCIGDIQDCQIAFKQIWPREAEQIIKRGMYITSENAGLKVYSKWEFENGFTRIYDMPSYYSPTDNEVKILECLNRDAEMCYPYSWICDETGLTRDEAKTAIDRLRDFGAVEFWRGLMDDDGNVAGSGFCWGDPHKAEALLYRHYREGRYATTD